MSKTTTRDIPKRSIPRPGALPMDGLTPSMRPFRPGPGVQEREAGGTGRRFSDAELEHDAVRQGREEARLESAWRGAGAGGDAPAPEDRASASGFPLLLLQAIEARIVRECPVSPGERAQAVDKARIGQVRRNASEAHLQDSERLHRRTQSDLLRTEKPALGTAMTEWWVGLVVMIGAAAIEMALTSSSLQVAMNASTAVSLLVSACIAVLLVAFQEFVGAALAGMTEGSSTRPKIAAGAIVGLLVLTLGWFVVSMAGSREENASFRAYTDSQGKVDQSPGFSGLPAKGAPGSDGKRGSDASKLSSEQPTGGSFQTAGATTAGNAPKPDLGFTIPLTIAVMLGAVLCGMRTALAKEWQDRAADLTDAKDQEEEAHESDTEERVASERAAADLAIVEQRVAAHTDGQQAYYEYCVRLFENEYGRQCRALGFTPREIAIPAPPDPLAAAERLIDPTLPRPTGPAHEVAQAPPVQPVPAQRAAAEPDVVVPAPPPQAEQVPQGDRSEPPGPPATNPAPPPPSPRRRSPSRDGAPAWIA